MNILFIFSLDQIASFEKPLYSFDQIQFGISYISSLLKKNKNTTRLIVLSKLFGEKYKHVIDQYVKRHHPQIVCFTSVATEYDYIASVASYIKSKYPRIYLLIGGPHASLNPDIVIKDCFDALCVGEGEYPTLELVNQLKKNKKPTTIKNIWFKDIDGKIQKNPPRILTNSIDNLPFPDRDMWNPWIERSPVSKLSILLGRGCPFNCAYCSNHALRRVAVGPYVRVRKIDNIMQELNIVAKKIPKIKFIHLEIETIGINKDWTFALAKALRKWNLQRGMKYSFSVNLRIVPQTDYDQMFKIFKDAGIRILHIGLESGSERIRKKVLRRVYSNSDVINVVRTAKNNKLSVYFFNLIGIPGESQKDFKKTVEINRICQPNDHFTSIFFPYPGTDLYLQCKKEGLLDHPFDHKMERARAVLDLPGFSKSQIQRAYIFFDYYIYRGHMSPIGIALRVIRNWSNGSPFFSRLLRDLQIFLWRVGLKKRIKKLIAVNK